MNSDDLVSTARSPSTFLAPIRRRAQAASSLWSLIAGATNTLSTTMIVLEVTNQQSLLVPVLIGVISSIGVTNLLSYSVFDQASSVDDS